MNESSPGRPVTLLPYLFHRVLRGCYTRDVGVKDFVRVGGLFFYGFTREIKCHLMIKSTINKRVTSLYVTSLTHHVIFFTERRVG